MSSSDKLSPVLPMESSGGPASKETTVEFLARLQGSGIDLWAEGEKLRFSAPKGALTAALKDEIRRRKPSLLAFLQQVADSGAAPPPIPRRDLRLPHRLSFAQERLWFFAQLEPESSIYNLSPGYVLRGEIRVGDLAMALAGVLERHAILRTRYAEIEGEPRQRIEDSVPLPLTFLDLSRISPAVRREPEAKLLQKVAQTPFDLRRAPTLRILMIRRGLREHVLLFVVHHISFDAWSSAVMMREVLAAYQALGQGRRPNLLPPPIQYAEFAHWQREWLESGVLSDQLNFWKRELDGVPYVLHLPTDRPRLPGASARGGRIEGFLPAAFREEVRAHCQRWDLTPFMFFQSVFGYLLGRWTGQRDLLVGSPIGTRGRVELEELVGFFVNTLVFRTTLRAGSTVEELLQQNRGRILGALAHQDLPFERLVDELQPQRDLDSNPIFQVMFAFENVGGGAVAVEGMEVESLPSTRGSSTFDLGMVMREEDDGFYVGLRYREVLFDATTIDRLFRSFRTLLREFLLEPSRLLEELPAMGLAERHQLLTEWNDTARSLGGGTVAAAVLEQARRTPQAPAVVMDGGGELTYGEFAVQAAALAVRLRQRGVGPDSLVAVCMDRCLEQVVALLGIWLAGGAYLPVDPSYPRERIRFLLTDGLAGQPAPLALVESGGAQVPGGGAPIPGLEVLPVALEPAARRVPLPGPDLLTSALFKESAAYCLYTSGSTGLPKGAIISQGALYNHMLWLVDELDLGPGDVVLQKTPTSFDASVHEFWEPLLVGGRLVLAVADGHKDPEYLGQVLRRHRVSVIQAVPSLWRAMEEVGALADQPALRTIISGGEQLTAALAQDLKEQSGAELINFYGPTEATIDTTSWKVRDLSSSAGVPIGRPVWNYAAHILDPMVRPVPLGGTGELFIAGDGLARCYHRRPALTAASFRPDPFSEAPGRRLYASGDLARWLADGTVEILGRRDHQVKVRGFRIEVGEVEAVLVALEGVREAVVVAREDGGPARLVTYLTVDPGVAAADILAELRLHLPAHLVPTIVEILETLPRQPNGKVDRRALPAPSFVEAGGLRPPKTAEEELLADLWVEVLGLELPDGETVDLSASFFDLGGHSLLATQVVSRARRALGIEIGLRSFFELPTIEGFADFLQRERRSAIGSPVGLPALQKRPPGADLPLSFAQQRLWFLDQMEGVGGTYHMPLALRLQGAVHGGALAAALGRVIARHESLRTVFEASGSEPRQVILPADRTEGLRLLDLSGVEDGVREVLVEALMRREAKAPFDLAAGPLFRARLLRLSEENHVLLLTLHHIVSDGWSLGVLTRDLTSLYGAQLSGRDDALRPLEIGYPDFALWQRSWFRGEVLEREMDFWRQQLLGAPPRLELPTDRPRPRHPSYRGASRLVRLPRIPLAALFEFGRTRGATRFMVLAALVTGWLARLSGQRDLVVGTPIAGRDQTQTEDLIGFFVNTLALRFELAPAATFADLVEQARDRSLGAYDHQHLPFERLVEELSPVRDTSTQPIFQVMFALQNAPVVTLEAPGLCLEPVRVPGTTAKFDLTLNLSDAGESYGGSLEYRTDLFDATTVDRWSGHLLTLLEAVAQNPALSLEESPWWSPAQRHQLMVEWAGWPTPFPDSLTIPQAFGEVVEAHPETLALVYGDESLTYRQAARLSRQWARELRHRGVSVDEAVGVAMEPSAHRIVALLAVLQANGAYLPLDALYPDERLAFMLEESRANLVLVDSSTRDRFEKLSQRLPAEQRPDLLDTSALQPEVESLGADIETAPRGCRPENLAYINYTSGSTGRPKGVAVSHQAVIRTVRKSNYFRASTADRFAQVCNISFDVFAFEVWGALLNGATLVGIERSVTLSPDDFAAALERQKITQAMIPTALFHQIVRDRPDAFRGFERLMVGGEALERVPSLALLEAGGSVDLINIYGPTEATVLSAFHSVKSEQGNVPIGRPISNTFLCVLDRQLQPVPSGSTGELCIGGAGLARGYQRRPALTAERFVPDPWSNGWGQRLYRTGDSVRCLPDGRLDFLGRLDHQVKIRGHRIEPGELEAALSELPGVDGALVMVAGEGEGKQLLAYAVGDRKRLEESSIRGQLEERLPAYLLPSAVMILDDFPLTPNGKVDRAALPNPRAEEVVVEEGYLSPEEELLADILASVLGLPAVSPTADFFRLGGHSLLATQVTSRVRQVFEMEMPLRWIFEAPSARLLARRLSDARVEASEDADVELRRPPLVATRASGPIPLSFAQQRLWFLDQLSPGSSAYNMPVGLRLRGALNGSALAAALEQVIERHESLRTVFEAREDEPRQVILAATQVEGLRFVDLSKLEEGDREAVTEALMRREARAPFDLAAGPLFRARLLRCSEEDHVLLLTLHHIVSDGWSMGVLTRDLTSLYQAGRNGRGDALPPLEIGYPDFAQWQRSWFRGEVLEREMDFWRQQLLGAPPRLELPTDRPRPRRSSLKGASRRVELPGEPLAELFAFGRTVGATRFMVLAALFTSWLARISGQQDLVVGTPIAGRDQAQTEDLIGFFVNTLALRFELPPAATFSDLVEQARERALGAYDHQHLPFERLVEELSPDRDTGSQPIFQVMFALQNAPVSTIETPELRFESAGTPGTTAKFDLTLNLSAVGETYGGSLDYSMDLFDATTIDRWYGHLLVLLEAAAENPFRVLEAIPFWNPAQRHQLMTEWAGWPTSFPDSRTIPELFREIVEAHPESPALVFGKESLSYREAAALSSLWAQELRRRGISVEEAVGVAMEPSAHRIVALLAILKAGGTYLPLDASYPDERLAFMLEDSGVALALVDSSTRERFVKLSERLPANQRPRFLNPSGLEPEMVTAGVPIEAPFPRCRPENLAYITYTSGSTGRPKGVALSHRAVLRTVREANYFQASPADRFAQVSNVSFDAFTYEVWGALLNGSALVGIERSVMLSPDDFAEELERQNISQALVATALFHQIVRDRPDAFRGLERLLVGGEALDPVAARAVLEAGGSVCLVNIYGPTEATTLSTFHLAEGETRSVPIGRPASNTFLCVLDRQLRPVPSGSAGELYIGGAGLARGYQRRPALTAGRFVPDPWSTGWGQRLYRTGDLVRWLPDGRLDFLGRLDHQVKIRGHRIEPGELETALSELPGVEGAVVMVAGQGEGKHLVAYVVGDPRGLDTSAIRGDLQERLPAYLLPSAVVILDDFPLTPNGKVDRAALPDPRAVEAPVEEGYLSPEEELLADILANVLGLSAVSPTADFFELGGHSLLATQVTSRVRQVFDVEMPLAWVFEAPSARSLARRLSDARVEASEDADVELRRPPLVATRASGPIPLSFAQQRLWFLDQFSPGSSAYNMPFGLRLRGALNGSALAAALEQVIERHESLRTVFEAREDEPRQVILPAARVEGLRFVDLSRLEEGEREAVTEALMRSEAKAPFDLAAGPLFRARLLRRSEEDHVLLLTLHHIVSDGWSMGVLTRDLTSLYEAQLSGRDDALRPLEIGYPDFALWQRSWFRGEVLKREMDFWRRQLLGAPARLELPADRPRPRQLSFKGASRPVELPGQPLAELFAFGRTVGATRFMVLAALFTSWLARISGQQDLVVGTPIAGRDQAQTEDLIGFFVNTLALRFELPPAATFSDLVEQARERALGAYDHQHLPFDRLVEELSPDRDVGSQPIFQVMFALQNAPVSTIETPELRFEPAGTPGTTTKFDLTLNLSATGDTYGGSIEYSTDLFDATTVDRWYGHLLILLEAVAENPARALEKSPWWSPAQRHQLMTEWAGWPTSFPDSRTIPELFREIVEAHPESPALVFGNESLSYREAAALSSLWAQELRRRGISVEEAVGVAMEPSAHRIVALLAILKAGGTYLPLDASYPDERLAFMLEDSGVALALVDSSTRERFVKLSERLPKHHRPCFLDPSELEPETVTAGVPIEAPFPRCRPENLAYITYTSGSTGRPKGVALSHRAVLRTVREANYFQASPADRFAQVSNVSFDAFTYEVWGALLNGSALVGIERSVMLSPDDFAEELDRQNISQALVATALFHQIVRDRPDAFRGLERLLVGGEALDPVAARAVLEAGGSVCLVNIYGPTEATTLSTFHLAEGETRSVPIGRPASNTFLCVLDRQLRPVPSGSAGELYIGGAGLARGYQRRPALTAGRFVPDPWSTGWGQRLYRTGDLVRWLPDGRLDFLGRLDHQVKIRGHRIEPGELEAALSELPGVEGVVVMVAGQGEGKHLVAYVVGDPRGLDTSAIRGDLQERLPAYLLPSAVVILDDFPLTPNGKVDRAALPDPRAVEAPVEEGYLSPEEELLADILANVLGLSAVSPTADFFELGGHSLLATQVTSRVRQVFDVEMPLAWVFEAPSARSLARRLSDARVEASEDADVELRRPPLVATRTSGPIPLSFAQQRLWFLDQLSPGSSAYNMPFGLRLRGALNSSALAAALEQVIERHESLRTVFEAREDEPRQVILPAARVEGLRFVDLSGLAEGEREAVTEALMRSESKAPFDLAAGPLFRARLLRRSEEDHVLLLTLHHIVSDGWSMGVLTRDLTSLYQAGRTGRGDALPPLEIGYPDFALWQRSWFRGEVLKREMDFWRRQLLGAPARLELPADRPRPRQLSFKGASRPVELPGQPLAELFAFGRTVGATRFMVLAALFTSWLARISGQQDLVVGTPIAGRDQAQTEDLIGFFVNTLALRFELPSAVTFSDLVKQARERALGAYDHQHLPFERLVEELSPDRDVGSQPIFQVMFALQNAPVSTIETPELRFEPAGVPGTTAKFDLTLNLSAAGETYGGSLEYSTDLFDATTVGRWYGHLLTLLEAVAENPNRVLEESPWWSPAQRHQLMTEWAGWPTPFPDSRTIPEVFGEIVDAQPEAPALVYGKESLSYREAEGLSSQWARELLRRGISVDEAVGVAMEPSAHRIVALLGILEAGGAYLPLDASYPDDRLAFMLEDSGVALVLVDSSTRERFEKLSERLPAAQRPHFLNPSELEPKAMTAGTPMEARPPRCRPENLAYINYTSGSSGRPKGVALSHRAVLRTVLESNYFQASPADRFSQICNFSFDPFTYEVWGALLNGAALVGIERSVMLSPDDFAAELERQGITQAVLATALFHQIVRDRPDAFRGLNHLLVGGEVLDPAAVREFLEADGSACLVNGYGPTEATLLVTFHRAEGEIGSIPIGRPVSNTFLCVLDRQLQPVPSGSTGELFIGGAGLARGYQRRPALTAHRFVPDPWSMRSGERLYRTGDLVRWLPEGRLDFLGRLDQQVKIRGHRIEPGELEAALSELPGVEGAVVMVSGQGENQHLLAYVVGDERNLDTSAMRGDLQERLPAYLLPSAVMILDDFPLTPNGKVDRAALPDPRAVEAPVEEGYLSPEEELLADILASVLGLPAVSPTADFFDLGGHSLLATQVVSRVRNVFDLEMPVTWVFEAPSARLLARRLSDSRDEASAVARDEIRRPPLVANSSPGPIPLSFAQQRLWFLDQLSPDSSAYNIPVGLRLRGAFSHEALAGALASSEERQQILRTTFYARNGEPMQEVNALPQSTLVTIDLTGLEDGKRDAEARRLAHLEAHLSFDLERGPVFRRRLLRLGEREHVLLLTIHHIAADGWSLGVLAHDVTEFYRLRTSGGATQMKALPVQYQDFARWQRGWLHGDVLAAEVDFWRSRLLGAPAVLELPTDRPRPAQRSSRGGSVGLRLSRSLSADLQQAARSHGATLFMALLAGFQVLLGRLSGQRDVVVGTPVAGRNRSEIEGLVGFFVNTLALRTHLASSFTDLLPEVRRQTLEAFEHQEVPFERLVEDLRPIRDLASNPVFQVMFALQNAPVGELAIPGVEVSPLTVALGSIKFDLSLNLELWEEEIVGTLNYSRDLFDATTVQRMAEAFQVVLTELLAKPRRGVWEVNLLSSSSRHQILSEWNDTARSLGNGTVAGAILEQARRTPKAPAVLLDGGGELSYEELAAQAAALAAQLRLRGVGTDSLVAVYMDRCLEQVVGFLGIWLAGGAYLPVDPSYPPERIRFLLTDALAQEAPRLVLMEPGKVRIPGSVGSIPGLEVLPVELDPKAYRPPSSMPDLPAESAAYCLYTSGSTGRPKGVVVSQGALFNHMRWIVRELELGPEDVVLQKTPAGFDASIHEYWDSLLVGGQLVFAIPEGHKDPEYLGQVIQRHRVSVLQAVPSLLRALEQEGALAHQPSLRTVISGGEPLPPELARDLGEQSHARLVNFYGPTEATIDATSWWVEDTPRAAGVPVGRPIWNLAIHVLSPAGEPMPIGATGELCISGAGLARCYHRRPALTAASFRPDSFSEEPGRRLYATGDLARWRRNGALEVIGRRDHQVKIRGSRVELGEVEAALSRQPGVSAATVIVRRELQKPAALVAYLCRSEDAARVAEGSDEEAPATLRQQLACTLPEVMVPSIFVELDALPLTPNGKVDRRALEARPLESPEPATAGTPPRDELEESLMRIWTNLLGYEVPGIETDFFEHGGHSLLAVQLVAGIRRELGRRLPLAALFQAPTLDAQARLLREAPDRCPREALVLLRSGEGAPLFLVHPVGGNLLCYGALVRSFRGTSPVYGLQRPLQLDGVDEVSLEDLAARYLDKVLEVSADGPLRIAGWSLGGVIAFEMARQAEALGRTAELVLLDSVLPPAGGPEPQETRLVAAFLADLTNLRGADADTVQGWKDQVELGETAGSLLRRALDRGLVPGDLEAEDLDELFAMFRSNDRAWRRYRPGTFAGSALLLVAADQARSLPPDLGWGPWIEGGLRLAMVPGDHHGLLRGGGVEAIRHHLEDESPAGGTP